jgi:hypothetical protein
MLSFAQSTVSGERTANTFSMDASAKRGNVTLKLALALLPGENAIQTCVMIVARIRMNPTSQQLSKGVEMITLE